MSHEHQTWSDIPLLSPRGYGEMTVSSKVCSLAFDEVELEEQKHDHDMEMFYQPELKVLVNRRMLEDSSAGSEPISVKGRINVSF